MLMFSNVSKTLENVENHFQQIKKKVLSLLYVDDEDSTSHIHGYYMVICVCIHC